MESDDQDHESKPEVKVRVYKLGVYVQHEPVEEPGPAEGAQPAGSGG